MLRVITFCIMFFSSAFFLGTVFAQVSDFQKIELTQKNVKESAILSLSETEFILFYLNSTQDSIFSIRSVNAGKTWQSEKFIKSITLIQPQEKVFLTTLKVEENRIILMWSVQLDSISYITSDNLGNNWSNVRNIGAIHPVSYYKRAVDISLVKSDDNVLFLSYSDINYKFLWLKKSTDSGETWSDLPYIINSGNEKKFNLSVQVEDNLTLHAYYFVNNPNNALYRVSSTDSGVTWSTPNVIFSFDTLVNSFRTVCTNDKKLWLVYQKKSSFHFSYPSYGVINYAPNDLFYMTSTTFGTNWSAEEQVTKYIGDDNFNNVAAFGKEPIISFTTQRFNGDYNLTFFIPGINKEISTPPCIVHSSIKNIANLKNKIVVSAIVINNEEIKKVEVRINDSGVLGELYDDGLHNDNEANDYIYSNIFDDVRLDNYNTYLIQTNKFRLTVNRNAEIPGSMTSAVVTLFLTITDINDFSFYQSSSKNIIIEAPNGYYDNVGFLFTGGFALSGLDSDGIWANGVFTSGLISDYLPGPVGSDPNAIENSIYVVKANDPPFGNSWNVWKKAVELGAEFYDGDNDGKYNPIDKNFNGIWDPNEDMPLIIGDETIWFVCNDGVPKNQRRFESSLKEIEIAQTVFYSEQPQFEDMIFIRYKVTNKSNVDYDSVYFSYWSDTDLGADPTDDIPGCDTILNSGFVYNSGPDTSFSWYGYGINPPAFFTTLLQGPVVQTGLSTDTAYMKLGTIIGQEMIPSSKNQNISAFISNLDGAPNIRGPGTIAELRNLMKGKTRLGSSPDPCNWIYGSVKGGIDCNEVDSKFWYSGDPVTQVGWICEVSSDLRCLLTTGPFKLSVDKPVDILGAFILGRGTDAINSITVARENVQKAIQEYKNNFSLMAYKPGEPIAIKSYNLFQNYPNPFNPTTTIRYALPEDGMVTLKIYDILGQEVKVIVNEFLPKGTYEVKVDSQGLASGVYIYRLKVGEFISSKKMMLLK